MPPYETLVLIAQTTALPLEQRQEAFAELIRRFQGLILNRARQISDDPHLAQDLAQETFLTAWCHLDQLQHPRAFPAWIKRILHTHLSRFARNRQIAIQPLDNIDHLPDGANRPDVEIEHRDLRQKVLDAIARLPDHERIIMELFYLEGISQRDISRRIDLPVKTVKSRLYSSRKRLQTWLADNLEDEACQTSRPVILAHRIRPDQARNQAVPPCDMALERILETERLKTMAFAAAIECQPVWVSAQQTVAAIATTTVF